MTAQTTTHEIAKAIGIGPRTKHVVIPGVYADEMPGRSECVLARIMRQDISGLPANVTTAAYALRKYVYTGRSGGTFAYRVMTETPYRLCAMVAYIVNECPEGTVGGICDGWLPTNNASL